jgi:ABC transport system ATP-binding/permease protein
MALISAVDLTVAFGGRPLLEGANLQIERGERVGLVGRNGEGKTTLLRIIAGLMRPDRGTVAYESGVHVGLLDQQVATELPGTVAEVISSGVPGGLEEHRLQRLCSLMALDPDARFATLSGGLKRRTLLGRALAADPDVLLLDEPTNHLDIESIEWLESFLMRFPGSLFFVTHDRAFLERIATRIVELDRGRLSSWACDYPTFLRRREEARANEEKEWAAQDRVLAKEEEWIRQGIKARRTRNEGRVRALERLREQRAARRERVGTARIAIQQAERTGTRVIVAKHVDFGYGESEESTPPPTSSASDVDGALPPSLVIRDFSTTIVRGDRVGIIGPNGSGKTTLINLLLGQIEPRRGTIKRAEALAVAYFDQHREQLDEARSVVDNLGAGGDHVIVDGERKHVLGYLQDFLFSPERARQPVGSLSGGERNRLLLARLFTRPANLLVLDEPTNDLDAETLELLETRLIDYTGTVLVVSHDRSFLDNLCTSTLVLEGNGKVGEYAGGYSDWKRVVERREGPEESKRGGSGKAVRAGGATSSGARADAAKPKKLTFAERRELEGLPARIEAMEARVQELHGVMAAAGPTREGFATAKRAEEETKAIEAEIPSLYARWEELHARE